MTLASHVTTTDGRPSLQIDGAIATIRLRRPAQRNALRDADLHALLDIFAAIDADSAVRVAVLAADTLPGTQPVFCAGYDVASFDDPAHDPGLFERIPEALELLRPVTLCALGGSVHGGATDLVLACDLRVAWAGSEFRMPAAALGLHYYPSGLRRFVTRLGPGLARQAFLTARPLPVEALAARSAAFEAVVEAADFEVHVAALAAHLATLAPLALQGTKQSLREIEAGRFDEGAVRARELRCRASADFAEGRAAARERRAPRFTGR